MTPIITGIQDLQSKSQTFKNSKHASQTNLGKPGCGGY